MSRSENACLVLPSHAKLDPSYVLRTCSDPDATEHTYIFALSGDTTRNMSPGRALTIELALRDRDLPASGFSRAISPGCPSGTTVNEYAADPVLPRSLL